MAPKAPLTDQAGRFVSGMPREYASHFGNVAKNRHAALWAARSGAASVGLFPTKRQGVTALVVIADDRPGLLATISAALIAVGLDVVDAEAYTRRDDSRRPEAVDVFWARRADQREVEAGDVADLERVLADLIDGRRVPELSPSVVPSASETAVRFIENSDGLLATLEVETDDRSGLLLALSQALYEQRVQIVGSEVHTRDHRVLDRFMLTEVDGSAIRPERRLEIQVAVLSALGPQPA